MKTEEKKFERWKDKIDIVVKVISRNKIIFDNINKTIKEEEKLHILLEFFEKVIIETPEMSMTKIVYIVEVE